MLITPEAIFWLGMQEANEDRYQVLYEASNYVLTAELSQVMDNRKLTHFSVFYLREGLYAKLTAELASLVNWYCNDIRLSGPVDEMNSAIAFQTWSDEKFLEEFAARCAKTISNPYSQVSFGDGWSGTGFYRP